MFIKNDLQSGDVITTLSGVKHTVDPDGRWVDPNGEWLDPDNYTTHFENILEMLYGFDEEMEVVNIRRGNEIVYSRWVEAGREREGVILARCHTDDEADWLPAVAKDGYLYFPRHFPRAEPITEDWTFLVRSAQ